MSHPEDGHKTGECWYEIPVELPRKFIEWREQNIRKEDIKEVPMPHITILYGFECKQWAEIDHIVKEAKITANDFEFAEKPRKGDFSSVWLLDLHSKKLQDLFWKLHAKYPNKHYLRNGAYEPHVTLCWMK